MTDQELKDMNAQASNFAVALIDTIQEVQETASLPEERKLLLILIALRFVHLQMVKAAELPPDVALIAETLAVEWSTRCPLPSLTSQPPLPNTGKANA